MKKLLILLVALILVTGIAFAQDDYYGGNGATASNANNASTANGSVQEEREKKIELFNMEFTLGFPVHWTNDVHDDSFYSSNLPNFDTFYTFQPDVTVTANTAFGVALNFNFTRNFGLTLDADMFFAGKLTGLAQPTSDYNTMFGANLFLGPVIYIVSNDVLRIPFGFGAHMYYFMDQLWIPGFYQDSTVTPDAAPGMWTRRSDLQFGPGVMIGVQFHFDRNIYIFSKTNVYIDLVRIHKIKGILYDGYGVDTHGLPNPNTGTYGNYYGEIEHTDVFNHVNWSIKPSIGIGVKF